jgi:hypothetical protein
LILFALLKAATISAGKIITNVNNGFKVSRKMMNLYFFSADKPIEFKGTINEDLTSSVTEGQRGQIILTSSNE